MEKLDGEDEEDETLLKPLAITRGEEGWKKKEEVESRVCLQRKMSEWTHLEFLPCLISTILHLNPSIFLYLQLESNEWSFDQSQLKCNQVNYENKRILQDTRIRIKSYRIRQNTQKLVFTKKSLFILVWA